MVKGTVDLREVDAVLFFCILEAAGSRRVKNAQTAFRVLRYADCVSDLVVKKRTHFWNPAFSSKRYLITCYIGLVNKGIVPQGTLCCPLLGFNVTLAGSSST